MSGGMSPHVPFSYSTYTSSPVSLKFRKITGLLRMTGPEPVIANGRGPRASWSQVGSAYMYVRTAASYPMFAMVYTCVYIL